MFFSIRAKADSLLTQKKKIVSFYLALTVLVSYVGMGSYSLLDTLTG